MKYTTLLVPVAVLATFAAALPSASNRYPGDQGTYRPRTKQETQPLSDNDSSMTPFASTLSSSQLRKLEFLPTEGVALLSLERLEMILVFPGNELKTLSVDQLRVVAAIPANILARLSFVQIQKLSLIPVKIISHITLGTVSAFLETPADVLESLSLEDLVRLLHLPIDAVRGMGEQIRREIQDVANRQCGHLRVQASDHIYSGFVSAIRDTDGRYVVVQNPTEAIVVDITDHNIVPRMADDYPALGGTFGAVYADIPGEDNFEGNSANFAMLTGTSKLSAAQPASEGDSSFNDADGAQQHIESAIYYFGENQEIHPVWVNRDGSSIPAVFGVNDQKQIIFSANIGQYAATYGGKSARVFCSE